MSDLDEQQRIGSLFMIGLPGLDVDASTRELIDRHRIHHFILFRRNIVGPAQVADLCAALREACQVQGLPPSIISIDQEGGTVTRLPEPFTQFEGARRMAGAGRDALIRYARVCARELLSIGVNMNLAPVLDCCPAGKGFFMEHRVLGEEPAEVAELGSLLVLEMQTAGLMACVKHFPGLGAAVLDPHVELPVVLGPKERLLSHDLLPFEAAMREGVAAVMTSHALYPGLDADNPGTLSPAVLGCLGEIGAEWNGLVITDDLEMGAIEKRLAPGEAAVRAFQAGADLLLICQNHDKIRLALAAIEAAVREGKITPERIARTCDRTLTLLRRFCLTRNGRENNAQ